ncbi:DUF1661 domain-containing protein [Porphyromonas gulae]|nr:DUF1661 domain-containing protein [Porphyromonas gulae]
MWSEIFFVVARKFFASHTKAKIFSRHVFRRVGQAIFRA